MENSVNPVIAVDGYSSTGKSSYAKMLAQDFKWKHIDTGAMYRAVTLYGIQNFLKENNTIDYESLIAHLPDIHIDFRYNKDTSSNDTFLNGVEVESEIREIRVSKQVSLVAKIPEVRTFLVEKQRELCRGGGVVVDGRDIGTIVFPDADLKFFITASIEERAKRRFKEFQQKNKPVPLEEVRKNIEERDFIDENREIAPLKKAADAILIDNSQLTKEETYQQIKKIIKEKFNI